MGIQIKCVYVPLVSILQKERRKLYNSTAFFYIHQFINGLCLVLVHTPFINLVPGPVCFHSYSRPGRNKQAGITVVASNCKFGKY